MEIQAIVREIPMKMKKLVLPVESILLDCNHSIRLLLAKRPAKENIEKFLTAEYTLHGLKLFTFLFGEKISKRIEENNTFWFDVLASAFSGRKFVFVVFQNRNSSSFLVSKNLRSFGEKMQMKATDLAHFRSIIETIHDGRLEDIPMFAQEAVNQGLASLIEKLYESGFMEA